MSEREEIKVSGITIHPQGSGFKVKYKGLTFTGGSTFESAFEKAKAKAQEIFETTGAIVSIEQAS